MADTKLSKSRLEALIAMASGMVAQPASGLAGLYGLATGGYEQGADNVAATQQALTYAPRDPRGLRELAGAMEPVTGRLERLKHFLGDKAEAHGASPLASTAAYMVPDTLLALIGARGLGMKGPKLAQLVQGTRELPSMGSVRSQIGAINPQEYAAPVATRAEIMSQAKRLGLPATGKTEEMANRVRIANTDPRQWTRADFDTIKPHLAVHQDVRGGNNVESILRDGLRSGMVDSVDALEPGAQGWSWAKKYGGNDAYVFLRGALKYKHADNPSLAPGNIPLFHARPEDGGSLFDAIQSGRVTTR